MRVSYHSSHLTHCRYQIARVTDAAPPALQPASATVAVIDGPTLLITPFHEMVGYFLLIPRCIQSLQVVPPPMSAAAVTLPSAINTVLHTADGSLLALTSEHQLVHISRHTSTEVRLAWVWWCGNASAVRGGVDSQHRRDPTQAAGVIK